MFPKTIFQYIVSQESAFDTDEINIGTNWKWNFKKHVQMIFHLKHGIFYSGANDWMRAFKAVMEPVLSLAYWTEDIEVKDVAFYIENANGRVLSFFVKKYHDEIYVKEHNLDELFDEITESDVDFGGTLVDMVGKDRPKAISLTQIAFCDQTDVSGGPIGIKMYLSPSKLRSMEKNGWFKKENGAEGSFQDLVTLADFGKDPEGGLKGQKENQGTGKNIEIYITRGPLPMSYLEEGGDENEIVDQIHITASYYNKDKKREGFTIYKKKSSEGSLKFFVSQKVAGRALGRGWGERMLGPQIWTNFLEIHKMQMLEGGAKTPIMTDDPTFTNRNKIQEMENNEVVIVSKDTKLPPTAIQTVNTANVQLYQNAINEWFEHAQYAGAAFDPLMGKESASGTTFRGQNQVVQQGKGPHDRLRGKRAKFIEEIYRDKEYGILTSIKKEILKGKKFLATLTGDEMLWVLDQYAINEWNKLYTEKVLNGESFQEGEKEMFMEEFKTNMQKNGSKQLLEWVGKEFEGVEIKMGINIAGKQKDLAALSDKFLSIIQFAFSNPPAFQQTLQIPGMNKAFNDILEYSGISQADFSTAISKMPQPPQEGATPSPVEVPAQV